MQRQRARSWPSSAGPAALSLALASACGSAEPEPAARGTLSVELLHLGATAVAVDHAELRLAAAADALSDSPSDLLCLQGLWRDEDRAEVRATSGSLYPYSLELPSADDETAPGEEPPSLSPPCSTTSDRVALSTAIGCLRASCRDASATPGDDRALAGACLSEPAGVCRKAFEALRSGASARCAACFETLWWSAESLSAAGDRCASSPGDPLAFSGRHGLLLLSRLPITEPSRLLLPSRRVRRAALSATIATASGEVRVACTALGAAGPTGLAGEPLSGDVYVGSFGSPPSWAAERDEQVSRLVEHLRATGGGRPLVLLANLGAADEVRAGNLVLLSQVGPKGASSPGAGLVEATSPSFAPSCTLCPGGRWLVDAEPPAPSWLNRVLVAGFGDGAVVESSQTQLGPVVVLPAEAGLPERRVSIAPQHGFRSVLRLPR